MATSELVFVPAPGISHIVSTVEFAKLLLARHAQLSVTVLCMNFDFTAYASAYTRSLVGSQTRVKLVDLPRVESPPLEPEKSIEHFVYVSVESVVPHVRDALAGLVSASPKVVGVVLDFFCMPLMDVAGELGLPSYMFVTSNLGFLAFMLYLPSRHVSIGSEFDESDPDSEIPGFAAPVPTSALPSAALNKHGGYDTFLKLARRFRDTKGIIVNSFSEMEGYALESLASDERTPPIYTVGPVLDCRGQPNPNMDEAQREKIMSWLDLQPPLSVVFLCFGSMGSFGAPQLREIALGLERSGHRFLWSVRVPQGGNLGEILPEGFSERTGERGTVCGWAPQVEVLSHGAVGGFVSHCGWNSIMESLWHGVPIATWPMYAEQQLNALRMVREFGMAVELRLDYRSGREGVVVAADEIDSAVRRLMESGGELRKKVREMSGTARKTVTEGGSSFAAVGRFIEDVLGRN